MAPMSDELGDERNKDFGPFIDPPMLDSCMSHDPNATYGIKQRSDSGLNTLCSVRFQDSWCINSTEIK